MDGWIMKLSELTATGSGIMVVNLPGSGITMQWNAGRDLICLSMTGSGIMVVNLPGSGITMQQSAGQDLICLSMFV